MLTVMVMVCWLSGNNPYHLTEDHVCKLRDTTATVEIGACPTEGKEVAESYIDTLRIARMGQDIQKYIYFCVED